MHDELLLAALEQAEKGRGSCAPNPSVGAVAVQNGKIIAQSWHKGAGAAHAEQLVLSQFPANTPNVTLYVTLEPCNHWGKTSPCTDAIIRHGINKVVYAYKDPNPIVSKNNTPKRLTEHQVFCEYYPLDEVNTFYESYNYWTKNSTPFVTAKLAQTLDGKIGGIAGKRMNLSNDSCRELTHQLRKKTDIILTTAQTIINDDPLLNVRIDNKQHSKNIAILDSKLRLTLDEQVIKLAKHTHIFYGEDLKAPDNTDNVTYHPVNLIEGYLNFKTILTILGELGYQDLFVEAGGRLFSYIHKYGLANRSYIYIVPRTLELDAHNAYSFDYSISSAKKTSWMVKEDNVVLQLDWSE